MMSNSNYSIGLQRLQPVHTAYCGLHNLAENWSWTRDVNGRDRDETETRARRWQFVSRRDRDETLVHLETVSRPRPRDRDHSPGYYIYKTLSYNEDRRYTVVCQKRQYETLFAAVLLSSSVHNPVCHFSFHM